MLRGDDGSTFILSKGADNIMRDLLSEKSRSEDWPAIEDHLHVFAKDGLRTLVLARRDVDKAWYEDWAQRYNAAETTLGSEREENVAKVAQEIESDLTVVGASAIEDKLQLGVPQTIANIKRAGIKLWVLTGDKQETAINIGTSCRLLNHEMEPLLLVNGETFDEVRVVVEVLGKFTLHRCTKRSKNTPTTLIKTAIQDHMALLLMGQGSKQIAGLALNLVF